MDALPSAESLTLEQRVRLLSGHDFWHTEAIGEAGVAAIMLSDGPHGLRAQLADSDHLGIGGSEPATCFPPAVTLGSSWDPDLAYEIGTALAAEARDLGVSVVLGPGVNLKRHPFCGRNFEYFSEDPLLTGRMATSMVRGLQDHGVGASLKHFAANNQENHRFISSSVVDDRTLRELYLRAFEMVVTEAQPWTVMCSYNLVNGVPASANRWLLTEVLREEWGFEGLVVSDWGAVNDRAAGVAAGMDLEMPGGHRLSDKEVLRAVRRGALAEVDVTRSAQRVLDLVARGGSGDAPGVVGRVDEHDALARRVAAAGTVLLTNDGTLPLALDTSLAVIGAFAERPRYQGGGSSRVRPTRLTTLLDALWSRGLDPTYAPGYRLPGDPPEDAPGGSPSAADGRSDPALVAEAVAAARAASVAVVMVGLPGSDESEGFDRDHLRLPAEHDALVQAVCAANQRTVVVLSNGSPVAMPWSEEPAAIVEAYLGGQASGAALADVLLGDAEPGGRLAESFPHQRGDVAADPFFSGGSRQVEYREGLAVGYRHHTTHDVVPAFAFGHGLSYTTFEWTDASLSAQTLAAGDPLQVRVKVTNTGPRAGSDVVQIYRHDLTATVARPRRELVGFAKVHLVAGQSETVTIDLDGRAFAAWDVTSSSWQVPAGPYELEVARSSVDIAHTVAITITGTEWPGMTGGMLIHRSDAEFRALLGRPVPHPKPSRPFDRDSTLEELTATRSGRMVAALFTRIARSASQGAVEDEGTEMVERSLGQFPMRAFASFAQGRLTWQSVDALMAFAERGPRAAVEAVAGGLARGVRRRLSSTRRRRG